MKKICLIFILLLIGCVSEYEDASDHPKYNQFINIYYILTQDMYISGVNMPPGYGKEIDIYIISSINPTWSGPEVITRDVLDSGTILRINSMQKCTNCLEDRVRAIVSLDSFIKAKDVHVVIDLEYILSDKNLQKIK